MRSFRIGVSAVFVATRLFVPAWGQASAAEPAAATKCAVHGVVTHLLSHAPVKRASLQLIAAKSENEAQLFGSSTMSALGFPSVSTKSTYTALSGADGSFCFENVPTGQYLLSGTKSGFLVTRYGAEVPGESGRRLAVGSSTEAPIAFAMIPQAVVSGRVVDEYDEPVGGVFVNLLARSWINGHVRNVPVRGATTNDLGEYRVASLAPGTYYVRVDPKPDDPSAPVGARGPIRTFFPGTISVAEASPLTLAAGAELSGIAIRMSYGPKHRVRGVVSGLAPSDRGGVTLSPEGEEQLFVGVGAGSMKADGSFEFSGVPPGVYTLKYVQISGDSAKGGRRSVEVGDHDVTDISIAATNAGTLRGRIRVEGTPPSNAASVDYKQLSVTLIASDVLIGPGAAASVQSDGTFAIRNIVTPGRYVVRTDPPAGAYLKSIQLGQTNVTNSEFEVLDGAAGEMEIVYRYGLATVSGTVQRADEGAAASDAHVVLVPNEMDPLGRGILFKGIDAGGGFSAADVPPGRYHVYAFELVDYSALHQPHVLKALEPLGVELELGDGASKSIALNLISSDKTRRLIAVAAAQ